MKNIFTLFTFYILLSSCNTTNEFIKFDQGCVEESDNGFISLFIFSKKIKTLKKYEKGLIIPDDNNEDNKTLRIYNSRCAEYHSSAKIINKKYYQEIIEIIDKIIVYNDFKNCGISVKFLNSKEKIIREGAINVEDYKNFKKEIIRLNNKYETDKNETNKINYYFHIIELGTDMK